MRRFLAGPYLLSPLMIASVVFSLTPVVAEAQGTQHKETDLDFSRRMLKRTEAVLTQTNQLEKIVVRGWNAEKKTSAEQKKTMS